MRELRRGRKGEEGLTNQRKKQKWGEASNGNGNPEDVKEEDDQQRPRRRWMQRL